MDKLKFCRLIDTTLDYYTLEPFDMFWTSGESSVFVKDDFKKKGIDHLNLKKHHSVLVKDEVPTSPKVSNNHKVNILHSPVLAIKYFGRVDKKKFLSFVDALKSNDNLKMIFDTLDKSIIINGTKFHKGKKLIQFAISTKRNLPSIKQIKQFIAFLKSLNSDVQKNINPYVKSYY